MGRDDAGCLSVYVLLLLVDKVVSANGLTKQSQARNMNRDIERVGGIREMPCSCRRRMTSART